MFILRFNLVYLSSIESSLKLIVWLDEGRGGGWEVEEKKGQLMKGGCTYPDPLFFLSWVCSFESFSSLSFTSLDMRQPYSKPYSDKNSLFQIIIIINLPYLVNY